MKRQVCGFLSQADLLLPKPTVQAGAALSSLECRAELLGVALEGAETHGTWRKKGGEWWIFNLPKIDKDREIDRYRVNWPNLGLNPAEHADLARIKKRRMFSPG